MSMSAYQYKEDLLSEIEGLPVEKLKQIIDFVCFIKAQDAIDPSQSYFWTKKWQKMENLADKDEAAGNIIGDGILNSLLEELNK